MWRWHMDLSVTKLTWVAKFSACSSMSPLGGKTPLSRSVFSDSLKSAVCLKRAKSGSLTLNWWADKHHEQRQAEIHTSSLNCFLKTATADRAAVKASSGCCRVLANWTWKHSQVRDLKQVKGCFDFVKGQSMLALAHKLISFTRI